MDFVRQVEKWKWKLCVCVCVSELLRSRACVCVCVLERDHNPYQLAESFCDLKANKARSMHT